MNFPEFEKFDLNKKGETTASTNTIMNDNKVTPDLEKPDFKKQATDLMWEVGLEYGAFSHINEYELCKRVIAELKQDIVESKESLQKELLELKAEYTGVVQSLNDTIAERNELKDWKESAIENFIDPIITYGQSAGFKLGSSITEGTVERAKERDSLKSELEEAKELMKSATIRMKHARKILTDQAGQPDCWQMLNTESIESFLNKELK